MRPLFKEPQARRKSDFYPTPPEATVALLASGAVDTFPRHVWEPSCGAGDMARPLLAGGFRVEASDLEDQGYGLPEIDFLGTTRPFAPAIITNPPFILAAEFITHTWALGIAYLALLLKADFFCAARRAALFESRPPAQILNLTWKPDFTGQGAPPMTCAWFVWRPDSTAARVSMLRRPAK